MEFVDYLIEQIDIFKIVVVFSLIVIIAILMAIERNQSDND